MARMSKRYARVAAMVRPETAARRAMSTETRLRIQAAGIIEHARKPDTIATDEDGARYVVGAIKAMIRRGQATSYSDGIDQYEREQEGDRTRKASLRAHVQRLGMIEAEDKYDAYMADYEARQASADSVAAYTVASWARRYPAMVAMIAGTNAKATAIQAARSGELVAIRNAVKYRVPSVDVATVVELVRKYA